MVGGRSESSINRCVFGLGQTDARSGRSLTPPRTRPPETRRGFGHLAGDRAIRLQPLPQVEDLGCAPGACVRAGENAVDLKAESAEASRGSFEELGPRLRLATMKTIVKPAYSAVCRIAIQAGLSEPLRGREVLDLNRGDRSPVGRRPRADLRPATPIHYSTSADYGRLTRPQPTSLDLIRQ
jgi:hypothetical protein